MVHQPYRKTKIIYLILTLRAFTLINTALMHTPLALNIIIPALMIKISMFKLGFPIFKTNHSAFNITLPRFNIVNPVLKP